jgi:hypothetical protein
MNTRGRQVIHYMEIYYKHSYKYEYCLQVDNYKHGDPEKFLNYSQHI